MDLRVRLIRRLIVYFVLLLVLACGLVALALREDVAEEIEASSRLAELMLAVSELPDGSVDRVQALIERGGLRHLDVALAAGDRPAAQPSALGWLTGSLGSAGEAGHERRLVLGDDVLIVRPNPASEVSEIVEESSRMLGLFVLFIAAAGVGTWRTVGAALRPVAELEAGVRRLVGDEAQRLPAFELKEFDRIARTVEEIAERLARAREAERQMGARLIQLQEEERRALARELHDEIGQALTAVGLSAAYLERHAASADAKVVAGCAHDIRMGVVEVSRQVAAVLKQLRPHALDGLGLVDAVRDLVDFWQARMGAVSLDARLPAVLPRLSNEAGLALYRTVQEALTNIHRHSGARRVRVDMAEVDGGVELIVEDDGCGCSDALVHESSGGLRGMYERARLAGGRVRLGASVLGGFKVTLWVPQETAAEEV